MLKRTILLLLFILLLSPVYSQDFNQHYPALHESFFPFDENTSNEVKVIRYIESFCRDHKIQYEKTRINNGNDLVSKSYNINILFKGSGVEKKQLVFLCPLNSYLKNKQFYDQSLSLEIMLNLILKIPTKPLKKDVLFIFAGASNVEGNNKSGVQYYIESATDLNDSFFTVIDLLSSNQPINFTGSSNKKALPLIILKMFNQLKIAPVYFNRNEIYRSRFEIQEENPFISLFHNENANAVVFTNKNQVPFETYVYHEKESVQLINFFYEWVLAFDKIPFPMELDYHYQYIDIFGIHLYVTETFQIIVFLLILFFSIVLRFMFPRFQRIHYQLFFKLIPYFILLFILFYSFTFIPYFLFFGIDTLFKLSKFYLKPLFLYSINLFCVPLSLIFILNGYLKKIQFSKRSFLFIYGALVTALLNLVIVSVIDISMAYLYIWTIITITIAQLFSRLRKVKYILYTLSPLPLVLLLFDLTYLKNSEIIQNINPVSLHLIFTLLIFPYALMVLRVLILVKNNIHYPQKRINLMTFITLLVLMLLSVFIMLSSSYQPGDQLVKLNFINNFSVNKSQLVIDSDQKIGQIEIQDPYGAVKYNINQYKRIWNYFKMERPYTLSINKDFYNENNYYINIDSKLYMEHVRVYLICPNDFYPIESKYPFVEIQWKEEFYDRKIQTVYQFNIERNVGHKLSFNIFLLESNYDLIIEIDYPEIDPGRFSFNKEGAVLVDRSLYIDKLSIKNE